MRRPPVLRALAVAAVIAAVIAPPAHAHHVEHLGTTAGLRGCSFSSTNDSVASTQNHERQFGEMDCYWAAADVLGESGMPHHDPEPAAIVVHGWIQLGDPVPGEAAWTSWRTGGAHCVVGGFGAAAGACAISYWPASYEIYLCVRAEMTTSRGTDVWHFDQDGDPANGAQCLGAIEVGQ